MHSFRVHTDGTVTWTVRHDSVQAKPKPKGRGSETAPNTEPSNRTQKARARAAEHAARMQKARDFRARSIMRFWSRAATPGIQMQLPTSQLPQSLLPPPPPPPPPMPPPLPPQPPPERQSPPSPTQPTQGARAQNKRAPSTPTSDSPVAPRSKTQVVPLPSPPPSIPPSPPSPTPSSPPPTPTEPAAEPPRAKRALQLPDEPLHPTLPPSPPSPKGSRNLPEPSGPDQSKVGDSNPAETPLEGVVPTQAMDDTDRSPPLVIRMECPRCETECTSYEPRSRYQWYHNQWKTLCKNEHCPGNVAGPNRQRVFVLVFSPEEALARKIK